MLFRSKVLDLFDIGKFETPESDYLVLKMKTDNELYRILKLLNKGLVAKYDIVESFPEYIPHMTLAELRGGTASKYVGSKKLDLVLKASKVCIEDLIISHGLSDEKKDRKVKSLTTFHTVERYFRYKHQEREGDNI